MNQLDPVLKGVVHLKMNVFDSKRSIKYVEWYTVHSFETKNNESEWGLGLSSIINIANMTGTLFSKTFEWGTDWNLSLSNLQ